VPVGDAGPLRDGVHFEEVPLEIASHACANVYSQCTTALPMTFPPPRSRSASLNTCSSYFARRPGPAGPGQPGPSPLAAKCALFPLPIHQKWSRYGELPFHLTALPGVVAKVSPRPNRFRVSSMEDERGESFNPTASSFASIPVVKSPISSSVEDLLEALSGKLRRTRDAHSGCTRVRMRPRNQARGAFWPWLGRVRVRREQRDLMRPR